MPQSNAAIPITEADEYAISVAKTEYREAYKAGDVDRLLALFAPEFVDWSEGEPSLYASEAPRALRLRATKLFQRYKVEMTIMMIRIDVTGNSASDRGWHKVRLRDKATSEETYTIYRYFETWVKQDGVWKINFIISNKEMPARMLPEEE
jgi:ketosteroid isomerase-like protein